MMMDLQRREKKCKAENEAVLEELRKQQRKYKEEMDKAANERRQLE